MNVKTISFVVGLIVAVLLGVWAVNQKDKIEIAENGFNPPPATTSTLLDAYQNQDPPRNSTTTTKESSTSPSVVKVFLPADVESHNSEASCYSIVNKKVYDLTPWISKHPGGAKAILGLCGKDGSEAFNKQHGGQEKAEAALKTFLIGNLK